MAATDAPVARVAPTEVCEVEVCEVVDEELVDAFARLHPQLSSSPPPDAQALTRVVNHPANTVLIARLKPELANEDWAEDDQTADYPGTPGETVGAETVGAETVSTEIVGAMTLVLFPLASGLRAWIEDVVVDASARGRGIGAALNRRAIEIARLAGARTVDLTSRSEREAANRLYRRLGFELRNTNVYRLKL